MYIINRVIRDMTVKSLLDHVLSPVQKAAYIVNAQNWEAGVLPIDVNCMESGGPTGELLNPYEAYSSNTV